MVAPPSPLTSIMKYHASFQVTENTFRNQLLHFLVYLRRGGEKKDCLTNQTQFGHSRAMAVCVNRTASTIRCQAPLPLVHTYSTSLNKVATTVPLYIRGQADMTAGNVGCSVEG